MKMNPFQWRSLKTRVTLFTLAIFVASTWTLAFYVSQKLHADMQRLLEKQQFSTVTVKADELNRELSDRLSALGRIASLLTSVRLSESEVVSSFLEARAVLLSQFNGGVIVLGLDGEVLAEAPLPAKRIGINYRGADGVADVFDNGRSTIGQPFLDKALHVPVFGMSVPIRDTQGTVIGALLGMTILNQRNFLDQVTESYYGKSGYFVLVEPGTRKIVTSTGRQRIMDDLPRAGSNPLIDRFVQGGDETGVTRDDPGVDVLASAKRVPVANWFIVAALPTDEAFALISDMKRYMFEVTLFLTVLAGGLTWWMIRRELAPMLSAIKTLATLSDAPQMQRVLPIAVHDEIGHLIEGFNHLLDTLGQREIALLESEERFRVLHNASFGGIAIHDQGIILDCNQGLSNLTGYSSEELVGMNGIRLVTPESRDTVMQNIRDDLALPYDAEGLRKDGTRYHVSIRGQEIPYKGRVVRVFEFRDITERKQMEEQARQLALHDILTKLPNRRLLSDRLRQSMLASKRSGRYGALMFLDLDHFKPLNDTHGHGVGDLLLIEAASRLRSCVREGDTVARFGGDEFVVMLGELSTSQSESATQAELVAEKIRTALAAAYRLPITSTGQADAVVEHHCTVSIGVTLFINHGTSEDDILKQADQAMYQAKGAGRDTIHFFASPS
jgi:diguanylate cyclase (GGDEF)-like protein/PAS domain S-box-containing protein